MQEIITKTEKDCKMPKTDKSTIIKKIMQISPFAMMAVMAVLCMTEFRGITAEKILEYTPSEPAAAIAVLLLMFALKSMSYFFPMFVLYAASGLIFPFWTALFVNIAGTVILLTVPYLVGRFAERELVEKIVNKSKKADKIRKFRDENEFFVCFFLRVISCLPCDVVSLSLGSSGIGYPVYLAGSVLGILPGMIATTIIGDSVTDPTSPQCIAAVCVNFGAALLSAGIYALVRKLRKQAVS